MTQQRVTIIDGAANVLDSAAGEPCDADATLDAFADAALAILAPQFPDVAFAYRWESSNADAHIDGPLDSELREAIIEAAREAGAAVYEAGEFWR